MSVASGASLNFEAASSHGIVIEAESQDGSKASQSFVIQVVDVQENPIGGNDRYQTDFLDDLQIGASGLLANDSDPDGDALTSVLVVGPDHGSLVLQSNGSFLYTPEIGYTGTVTFVYRATDGGLSSSDITVTIEIVMPIVPPPTGGGGAGGGSSGSGSGGGTGSSSSGGSSSGSTSNDTNTTNDSQSQDASSMADSNEPLTGAAIGAETGPTKTESSSGTASPGGNAEVGAVTGEFASNANLREDRNSALSASIAFSTSYTPHSGGLWNAQSDFRQSDSGRRSVSNGSEDWGLVNDASRSGSMQEEARAIPIEQTVVQTVIGTGLVIWVVQGVQIIATLLSTTPAWIQLDPLNVLSSNSKSSDKEDEDDQIGIEIHRHR